MPRICYVPMKFQRKTLDLIAQSIAIIDEYTKQGYDLTLRQLYYQLVSRDVIANKQTEYKRLGGIISDARRAGLIDWYAIVDRTRNLRGGAHWESPASIIESAAGGYAIDKWSTQPHRVEIWIEKDALAGVFDRVSRELDIPFFSCRGYTSDSEMWVAAQRLRRYAEGGQDPIILHFGDHDPSGIDMTRDIEDRLRMFSLGHIEVRRLALTMDQVREHEPPPNPAKDTDARYEGYRELYGDESWELDALNPTILGDLARSEVEGILDHDEWANRQDQEDRERAGLELISNNYQAVTEFVRGLA